MTTEPTPSPRPGARAWPLHLAACCIVLTALAFRQRPGLIVPDTKLDLTADPAGFLSRAMHLWEPAAAFGQLQNQAYGYLFPMGPFHLLGGLAGLPEWVVQRLWWSLILVVAFLGMVRLAGELGIGQAWTRLLGGLAFALTPRILVSLGAISIEAWPTALAPWVLVPLVRAWRGGSVVRHAAGSAGAIACMGGVNAAATAAAVLPSVLWLVLTPNWPGRARATAWWLGCTMIATAWWWGPLLLLGAHGPPFLDWIETSANTTQHTSLIEVLRGSNHWLSYLDVAGEPQWPAGRLLAAEPVLILDTVLVAALGLAGLARRDMPARRVLLAGAAAGLVLVSAAYVGPAASPVAEQVRDLLDGPLAPFRNVHKFDVVLRVPLVLGLVHVLAMLPALGRSTRRFRIVAAGLTVVVLAGVATPALVGRLPQPGSYDDIPAYWHDAADWLDDNAGSRRALLLPASPFAEYVWGAPRDEPLQALTDAHWAVRDSVPLSSAGNIRLLDAIERRLGAGRGGAGVSTALRRAGVGLLVVRNDLDRSRVEAPRPALVHQALAEMPGVERVATFGPEIGAGDDPQVSADSRLDVSYPAVEIYQVMPPEAEMRVRSDPLEGSLRMSGGPESLLTLGDAGLLDGRATFVAGDGQDVVDPDPVPVVTDGLRRRAVWFGAIRDNATHVLAAGDDGPLDRAARDFLPVDDPQRETVAVAEGVASVTASSSGADPLATMARGPENSPWAALDGDVATSWISGVYGEPEGQWIEIAFDEPHQFDSVELVTLNDGPIGAPPARVEVSTDTGAVATDLDDESAVHQLAVAPGETSTLRVRVLKVGAGTPTGVGVRELRIPGVTVRRMLKAAPVPAADLGGPEATETLMFATADARRGACVHTGDVVRCARQLARTGEENGDLRRRVDLHTGGRYTIEATVRPRPGTALEEMIDAESGGLRAEASSRAIGDPLARPQAAVDLDPGTGWIAAPDDPAPTLTLSWPEPRTVDGVQLVVHPWLAASRPRTVEITVGGATTQVEVDDEGRARLPEPVETTQLDVHIAALDEVVDTGVDFGLQTVLPAGASEVRILGTDELRAPTDQAAPLPAHCGSGPDVAIDSTIIPTRLDGTVGDALHGRAVPVRACLQQDGVQVYPGVHDFVLETAATMRPESLTLRPADGLAPASEPAEVQVRSWEPTHREVAVAEREVDTVLTVTENANEGWQASLDGDRLEPVRIDGWAQGFVVPAGAGGVIELTYRPDTPYRVALGAGGVGVVVVAGLWWFAGRAPATSPTGPPGEPARARPNRRSGRHGARRPRWTSAASVAGAAALVVLGGAAGAAAVAGGVLVLAAGWRWPAVRRVAPAIAAAVALAAGVVVALDPWPGPQPGAHSGVAQVLVLVAVAVAVIGTGQTPQNRAPRSHVHRRRGYWRRE